MWKVESGQGRDLIVRKTDGATIAIMGSNATHEDAHRICACVAACDGIDTASLSSRHGVAAEIWTQHDKRLKQVQALNTQRNELMDALKSAEQWIVEAINGGCKLRSEQTLQQLRAAIAKAEGGAA